MRTGSHGNPLLKVLELILRGNRLEPDVVLMYNIA